MKNAALSLAMIAMASMFVGCPGGNTVTVPTPSNFPTMGTICSLYTYTFTTPATITSYSGLPGWLSFGSSGISNTISGTPETNDFGDFTISGSGVYQGKTGVVTGTIHVDPPGLSASGGPFDVTLSGSNVSNEVTLTASPSGCACTFTLTKVDWPTNRIKLPQSPVTSNDGTLALTISMETDAPGNGSVVVRIVPTGAGEQPVTVTIPVNAHF